MAGTSVVGAVIAGVVLSLAATPGAAVARGAATPPADDFETCSSLEGVLCRYVSVPLDYSHETPGDVRLLVIKLPPGGRREERSCSSQEARARPRRGRSC